MFKSKTSSNDKIILSFDNAPKGFRDNNEQNNGCLHKLRLKKTRSLFGKTIIGNVFSKEGLPLCPFRTDDWDIDQSPLK
jgi:hypothetical protein